MNEEKKIHEIHITNIKCYRYRKQGHYMKDCRNSNIQTKDLSRKYTSTRYYKYKKGYLKKNSLKIKLNTQIKINLHTLKKNK